MHATCLHARTLDFAATLLCFHQQLFNEMQIKIIINLNSTIVLWEQNLPLYLLYQIALAPASDEWRIFSGKFHSICTLVIKSLEFIIAQSNSTIGIIFQQNIKNEMLTLKRRSRIYCRKLFILLSFIERYCQHSHIRFLNILHSKKIINFNRDGKWKYLNVFVVLW